MDICKLNSWGPYKMVALSQGGKCAGGYKTHVRTTFGSWDVEKAHAVMVRSTCRSQNVQNTCSDHFWKLRCSKSARCGAKQISKSKCTKHHMFGPQDVVLRGRCKGFGRHSARDMFMRHFVWPGLIFNAWQAQYFRQIEWKTAKRIGMRPSALHSIFHFWRKSRRIA